MKKIFKRVSAAVIALAVAATAVVFDVPEKLIAAATSDFHAEHRVCGETSCSHEGHEAITDWTTINNASGLKNMTNGGHYRLYTDITLTDQVEIASDVDVTLCLNGKTITAASGKRIFKIKGSLTLCDCKGGGKLTGGGNSISGADDYSGGGAIYIYKGTFNMYGGTISGNTASNTRYGRGGGVYMASQPTFNMYGGTISDNTAYTAGGGVYVSGGIFTMYDGTIQNNQLDNANTENNSVEGGGVMVDSDGEFIMNGGTIKDNTALTEGGGVYDYGKFTMNGGTISGNKTTKKSTQYSKLAGGGVYAYGSSTKPFIMNGGTISNNTSAGSGGGVYSASKPFIMNGGTISGNTAETDGGGVYANAAMTLNGNVTITGNKSGTGDAKKDDNVYLSANKTLTIGSSFSTTSPIGITTSKAPTCQAPVDITTTDNVTENTVNSFKADKAGQNIVFADGKLQFKGAHTYDATTGVCTACGNAGTLGNVNWTYDENSKTFTISGEGIMINWTNAASIPWADKKANIKKVVIEDGITSVGSYAFNGCTNLTDVSIPDSVSTISRGAFKDCTSLTEINIPDSVQTIDVSAFDNTGLTKVTIPDSVNKIGDSAFANCNELETVTFEGTTPPTTMGSNVFNGCTALDKIIVPEGAKNDYKNNSGFTGLTDKVTDGTPDNKCGDNATWAYDEATKTLTISGTGAMTDWETINSIPWADKQADIEKIVIEDGITSIGETSFINCTNLASVTIADTVTTIGEFAFSGCSSLAPITLPENVTSIGRCAFHNCTSLETIKIPSSVNSIGRNAFNGCSNLASIEIAEGITSIGNYAFSGCSGLTSITIPNSVTSIGEQAFSFCSELASITIPNSVTSIGEEAFRNCSKLVSITIPDKVTSIGNYTFYGCTELTEVTIPKKVTTIGNSAFDGCTKLETVTFKGENPPTIDDTAFNGCNALDKIAVPEGKADAYKNALTGLAGLPDKVTDSTTDNKCGDNATWALDETTKTLTISGTGDMDSWLDDKAPWVKNPSNIINIQKVVIEDGITSVGVGAFRSCIYLTSVNIPSSVTLIKAEAFASCRNMEIMYPSGAEVSHSAIPETATKVEYTVNNGKLNVTKITLGTGKTSVTVTDDMGISSVAAAERSKVSQTGHTHTGGTATCVQKAKCDICNAEHGDLAAHTLTHVPEVPATETTTGVKEHWHCDDCDKNFADKNGKTEMTNSDLTIPVIGHTHTLTHVPEVPATETTAGTKEHWHCDGCGKNFADKNGTTEMINSDLTIPVIGHTHTLTHIPEVPATETTAGTKEHWHCDDCGKDFADEDGTKEVTADDLKIGGNIKTEVQAPSNVPKPEIATPKEELIAAALTEDEQKKVEDGTDIKIILKVEDASDSASAEDKGKIETAIGDLENYNLGQYLDITLLKKIGDQQEEKVIETNTPIKITFEIPSALRGKAEYSVIRVHNGEATILPDLDSDPDTVTIETDKFSTYALTYQEKAATSDPGDDPSGGNPGSNSDPSSTVPTESDNSDTTSNGDNSSDSNSNTTPNGSDTNSSGGTSSSDESNHAPSESSPYEDNGNPSTGIAVSLIPFTAALAVVVITANRRRK